MVFLGFFFCGFWIFLKNYLFHCFSPLSVPSLDTMTQSVLYSISEAVPSWWSGHQARLQFSVLTNPVRYFIENKSKLTFASGKLLSLNLFSLIWDPLTNKWRWQEISLYITVLWGAIWKWHRWKIVPVINYWFCSRSGLKEQDMQE